MSYFIQVGPFEEREDAVAFIDVAGGLAPCTLRLLNERGSRGITPVRETRTGKVVLSFMQYGRSYHISDVAAALEEAGYKGSTASGRLHDLMIAGDVKAYGEGIYQKVAR